jgi:hypothetical protein
VLSLRPADRGGPYDRFLGRRQQTSDPVSPVPASGDNVTLPFAGISKTVNDGTRTRDLRRDRPAFAFTPERGIWLADVFDDRSEVPSSKSSERLQVASTLQASGFRSDVTAFRLNAQSRRKTGSEPAFRRDTAEPVHTIEAAHNPEVAGSNPAPAIS